MFHIRSPPFQTPIATFRRQEIGQVLERPNGESHSCPVAPPAEQRPLTEKKLHFPCQSFFYFFFKPFSFPLEGLES